MYPTPIGEETGGSAKPRENTSDAIISTEKLLASYQGRTLNTTSDITGFAFNLLARLMKNQLVIMREFEGIQTILASFNEISEEEDLHPPLIPNEPL